MQIFHVGPSSKRESCDVAMRPLTDSSKFRSFFFFFFRFSKAQIKNTITLTPIKLFAITIKLPEGSPFLDIFWK